MYFRTCQAFLKYLRSGCCQQVPVGCIQIDVGKEHIGEFLEQFIQAGITSCLPACGQVILILKLMHDLDVDRVDLFLEVVEVSFPVLPDTEQDGAATDQQQGQEEDADHGKLDLVLDVHLETPSEKRNIYQQQVHC